MHSFPWFSGTYWQQVQTGLKGGKWVYTGQTHHFRFCLDCSRRSLLQVQMGMDNFQHVKRDIIEVCDWLDYEGQNTTHLSSIGIREST